MYSDAGIDNTSSELNSSADLVFQLFANLGFCLTTNGAGAKTIGAFTTGPKLALAAVDATDCAIDGTVNEASLEDFALVTAGLTGAIT